MFGDLLCAFIFPPLPPLLAFPTLKNKQTVKPIIRSGVKQENDPASKKHNVPWKAFIQNCDQLGNEYKLLVQQGQHTKPSKSDQQQFSNYVLKKPGFLNVQGLHTSLEESTHCYQSSPANKLQVCNGCICVCSVHREQHWGSSSQADAPKVP